MTFFETAMERRGLHAARDIRRGDSFSGPREPQPTHGEERPRTTARNGRSSRLLPRASIVPSSPALQCLLFHPYVHEHQESWSRLQVGSIDHSDRNNSLSGNSHDTPPHHPRRESLSLLLPLPAGRHALRTHQASTPLTNSSIGSGLCLREPLRST